VYNKIDRLEQPPALERDAEGRPATVWISAEAGVGIDLLHEAIAERLSRSVQRHRLRLPVTAGAARARLFESGVVVAETADEGGWLLTVDLPATELAALIRPGGGVAELVPPGSGT
jgi:GTP-binding protein HflX